MLDRLLVGDYKRNQQGVLLDLALTYINSTSTSILKSII